MTEVEDTFGIHDFLRQRTEMLAQYSLEEGVPAVRHCKQAGGVLNGATNRCLKTNEPV